MSIEIVTDISKLRTVSENATREEAKKIWPLLEEVLKEKKGLGLSAIQIGIPKRVAVIIYEDRILNLLNTKIINAKNEMVLKGEGCLSIPGVYKNTVRFSEIEIEDENHGKVIFSLDKDDIIPFVIQHELDHFDGKLMIDRLQKPFELTHPKIGRNEQCPCGSGKKYKKCCGKFE